MLFLSSLYPTIVMWRWQLNLCQKTCANKPVDDVECCNSRCSYQTLNLISQDENEDKSYLHDPSNGLLYSFSLSVGNDSEWKSVITEAARFCNNYVQKEKEFEACGIPKHLYSIINCAYNENYFHCPNWNRYGIAECELTKEYIDFCFRKKL